MKKGGLHTGQELRGMLEAATSWLAKHAPQIDALNVFPVPDGDCGTNMTLTLQSTIAEAHQAPDHSASVVAQAIAKGALMGARGNSGVILSQIFRGMAEALEGKEFFSSDDFAKGLARGAHLAYLALANPTEGTILTVAKEAADAAVQASAETNDLTLVLESATLQARDSVTNTPNLLPVLKEAGVVDAGGQGLYILLDGMLKYLRGESDSLKHGQPQLVGRSQTVGIYPRYASASETPYGYCTEFLLRSEALDLDSIKKRFADKGQSLIVAGDDHVVRIHLHTLDPGSILSLAASIGSLHDLKIQNMDDQHKEFLKMTRGEAPATRIATIAVALGEGLRDVFQSLGATVLTPGSPATSPSTQELLDAVEAVPQEEVIILPNDKNSVPTANQVPLLTTKKVAVVPTVSIPQGIAAMFSLNYEADLATNLETMKQGITAVKTLEITTAVRSTRIGNFEVAEGQAIGFVGEKLIAAGPTPSSLLQEMLYELASEESEVITIYYGNGIQIDETEKIADNLRQRYPDLQIDVVYGGQPHYHYIASIE